ncbi:spectrin beta chain [Anaeramoeba ignava]|uniref:Spectrin beta chain n=1 Tax=Anaeramoeba ignava TaxID=1746090 RepID=A0A9Q0LWE3_ANAIG|nr:spectrin beta chain [Anaeramoeba ignava]
MEQIQNLSKISEIAEKIKKLFEESSDLLQEILTSISKQQANEKIKTTVEDFSQKKDEYSKIIEEYQEEFDKVFTEDNEMKQSFRIKETLPVSKLENIIKIITQVLGGDRKIYLQVIMMKNDITKRWNTINSRLEKLIELYHEQEKELKKQDQQNQDNEVYELEEMLVSREKSSQTDKNDPEIVDLRKKLMETKKKFLDKKTKETDQQKVRRESYGLGPLPPIWMAAPFLLEIKPPKPRFSEQENESEKNEEIEEANAEMTEENYEENQKVENESKQDSEMDQGKEYQDQEESMSKKNWENQENFEQKTNENPQQNQETRTQINGPNPAKIMETNSAQKTIQETSYQARNENINTNIVKMNPIQKKVSEPIKTAIEQDPPPPKPPPKPTPQRTPANIPVRKPRNPNANQVRKMESTTTQNKPRTLARLSGPKTARRVPRKKPTHYKSNFSQDKTVDLLFESSQKSDVKNYETLRKKIQDPQTSPMERKEVQAPQIKPTITSTAPKNIGQELINIVEKVAKPEVQVEPVKKPVIKVVKVFLIDGSFKTLPLKEKDTIQDLIGLFITKARLQNVDDFVMVEKKGSAERILAPELNAYFIRSHWEDTKDDFTRFVFKNSKEIRKENVVANEDKMITRVYFEDGSYKTIPVTKRTTCADVTKTMCQKIWVTSLTEFGIFEKRENEEDPRMCEEDERPMDLLKYWETNSVDAILLFKESGLISPEKTKVLCNGLYVSPEMAKQMQQEMDLTGINQMPMPLNANANVNANVNLQNQKGNRLSNPKPLNENSQINTSTVQKRKRKTKIENQDHPQTTTNQPVANVQQVQQQEAPDAGENSDKLPVMSIRGDKTGFVDIFDPQTNEASQAYLSLQGTRVYFFKDFQSTRPSGNFLLLNASLTQKELFGNNQFVFIVLTMNGEQFHFKCDTKENWESWITEIKKRIITTGAKKDPRKALAEAITRGKSGISSMNPKILSRKRMEEMQQRTFLKWINYHLEHSKSKIRPVQNIEKDLCDGVALAKIVEDITGETLGKIIPDPTAIFQKMANLSVFLQYLKSKDIVLSFICEEDILDGAGKNLNLLIWNLIYRLENNLSRNELLQWIRDSVNGIPAVDLKSIENFDSCFKSGVLLNALLFSKDNSLPQPSSLLNNDPLDNFKLAFDNAFSKFMIPKILSPQDFKTRPDERSVMAYMILMRKQFNLMKK